jgi:hypothetical protein
MYNTVNSSPPSLAEASYGGRSPQVDREGEILAEADRERD